MARTTVVFVTSGISRGNTGVRYLAFFSSTSFDKFFDYTNANEAVEYLTDFSNFFSFLMPASQSYNTKL